MYEACRSRSGEDAGGPALAVGSDGHEGRVRPLDLVEQSVNWKALHELRIG